MTERLVVALTRFQTQEVEHGLQVDIDDGMDEWGRLTDWKGSPRARVASLTVLDVNDAVWRITSARDIAADNDNHTGARSLQALVDKILAHYGTEALTEGTRHFL